jgi:hypothetical protein
VGGLSEDGYKLRVKGIMQIAGLKPLINHLWFASNQMMISKEFNICRLGYSTMIRSKADNL